MSNHNYNNYYSKKFEEKRQNVTEPEKVTPEIAPEQVIPEIPNVQVTAKVAEVTPVEPEVPAKPEAVNGVVFNCVKLNVREKPVAGSRVVTIIDAGSELTVTNDDSFGNFYKICTTSGVEGYCIKDYVRLV